MSMKFTGRDTDAVSERIAIRQHFVENTTLTHLIFADRTPTLFQDTARLSAV